MLRPTAARAFAAPPERTTLNRDPAEPKDRLEAVERFFSALRRALVHGVSSGLEAITEKWEARSPARMASRGARGGDNLRRLYTLAAPLRVGKERALLEGSEFVLETPRSSYRFLNTHEGVIWVHEVKDERLVPREIIGVQRTREGYQPIRKRLGPRRGGFQTTSIKVLVDAYLGKLAV